MKKILDSILILVGVLVIGIVLSYSAQAESPRSVNITIPWEEFKSLFQGGQLGSGGEEVEPTGTTGGATSASGNVTHPTDSDDDFAAGGTDSSAPFYFDVSEPKFSMSGILETATVTASSINGTIVVDGVAYSQDGVGIQNAIDDLDALGGGILELPKGTTTISSTITVPNNGNCFIIKGHGEKETILVASGTLDPIFSFETCGTVMDLTVDGNGTAVTGLLGKIQAGGNTIDKMMFERITARNGNGQIFRVWDQTNSYAIKELHVNDVTLEGPSDTAGDAFSIAYVDVAYFTNFTMRDLYRSPNFYIAKKVFIDGMYVENIANTAGFVIDSIVGSAYLTNVHVDANSADPWILATTTLITNSEFLTGIDFGNSSTEDGHDLSLNITGTKLNNIDINYATSSLEVSNVRIIGTSDEGAGIYDLTPSAGTLTSINVNNSYFDVTNTTGTRWLGSANGTTWKDSKFNNNTVVGGTTIYNITQGDGFQTRNNTDGTGTYLTDFGYYINGYTTTTAPIIIENADNSTGLIVANASTASDYTLRLGNGNSGGTQPFIQFLSGNLGTEYARYELNSSGVTVKTVGQNYQVIPQSTYDILMEVDSTGEFVVEDSGSNVLFKVGDAGTTGNSTTTGESVFGSVGPGASATTNPTIW